MVDKKIFYSTIIGCGGIASKYDELKKGKGIFTHAGAYKEIPEIRLTACADADEKRLEEFSIFWSVPYKYNDYRELFAKHKDKIDILSVCTPDHLHYVVITDALKNISSLRLIFAEKPLAVTVQEGEEIINECDKRNVKIVVNNQRRWDNGHLYVKDLISSGELGRLVAGTAYYVKGIIHIGCTVIDTLRFLLGKILKVQALPPGNVGRYGKDKSIDAVLWFGDDSKVVMQSADKYDYTYSVFEIDLLLERGRIRICDNGDNIYISKVQGYRHYSGFRELAKEKHIPSNMAFALLEGVKRFPDILSGKDVSCGSDAKEALEDLKVIEAIMKSKEHGYKRVKVGGQ